VAAREFTDRIHSFFTHPAGLVVKFQNRDANYVVPYEREDFAAWTAQLAEIWRRQLQAKVVVGANLELIEVRAVEPPPAELS
jgi:hypothetical protein